MESGIEKRGRVGAESEFVDGGGKKECVGGCTEMMQSTARVEEANAICMMFF